MAKVRYNSIWNCNGTDYYECAYCGQWSSKAHCEHCGAPRTFEWEVPEPTPATIYGYPLEEWEEMRERAKQNRWQREKVEREERERREGERQLAERRKRLLPWL